jgi:hypothetical protein
MADVDGAVAGLAERQFGLFSRAQVLSAGGTGSLIDRRLRSTRWLKVAEGVYGLPVWPDSWRRRLMAACLEAGPTAVVSHQSAAALHKLPTFCEGPVVVMLAHGDHQRLGSQLRQSTDFRWHARMDQMEADRRRDNEALNHGWRPYRFMWADITTHPERVAATVRNAVARVPSA